MGSFEDSPLDQDSGPSLIELRRELGPILDSCVSC
jgi:hypothetical protein